MFVGLVRLNYLGVLGRSALAWVWWRVALCAGRLRAWLAGKRGGFFAAVLVGGLAGCVAVGGGVFPGLVIPWLVLLSFRLGRAAGPVDNVRSYIRGYNDCRADELVDAGRAALADWDGLEGGGRAAYLRRCSLG